MRFSAIIFVTLIGAFSMAAETTSVLGCYRTAISKSYNLNEVAATQLCANVNAQEESVAVLNCYQLALREFKESSVAAKLCLNVTK